MNPSLGSEPDRTESGAERRWRIELRLFVGAERVVLALVAAMFFVAAFALAIRAMGDLWSLIVGPRASAVLAGTTFLDSMLLVLMLVELAYTVVSSFRGSELTAVPFLIVGLIAVIRRILVITVGEVDLSGSVRGAVMTGVRSPTNAPIELGVLTAIVLVFVCSIALLRPRLHGDDPNVPHEGNPDNRWS